MKKIKYFIFLLLLNSCNNNPGTKDVIIESNAKNVIAYENILISDTIAKKLFIKGLQAIEGSDYSVAMDCFDKANKIEANNVIILNGLANIQNRLGKKIEAEKLYKSAISIDSTYIISYINYGNLLMEKNQLAEANEVLLTGLQFNSSNSERTSLYYNLALTNLKSNHCESAKGFISLAIDNVEDKNQKNDVLSLRNKIETDCSH